MTKSRFLKIGRIERSSKIGEDKNHEYLLVKRKKGLTISDNPSIKKMKNCPKCQENNIFKGIAFVHWKFYACGDCRMENLRILDQCQEKSYYKKTGLTRKDHRELIMNI